MSPKTIKFMIRLFVVLAVLFGGLAVFALVVPWARSALAIAVAFGCLCGGMAIQNSRLLDNMEK